MSFSRCQYLVPLQKLYESLFFLSDVEKRDEEVKSLFSPQQVPFLSVFRAKK